jgi:hypothetical protein
MAKKNTPPYDWTVMVYLAGDNNLTEESVFSLTEMEKVVADDRIAVVAQFDPGASNIPTHGYVIKGARSPKTSRGRTQLAPVSGGLGNDAISLKKPKITFAPPRGLKSQSPKRKGGETDSGDPATLFNFMSWAREYYEAEHYMVVLAGHGAGTEEDFLLRDQTPRNSLRIPDLREVFAQVKTRLNTQIDILGMDVCLMSMVEVCYELKGLVDYIVASESFSPAAGWPYGEILRQLQIKKHAKTEDIAKALVGEYIAFYSDYVMGGLSVDQSVLNVSAVEPVAEAVKKLAATIDGWLTDPVFHDAIILAHWEAQSYNGEMFVDLQDFCELLAKRYPQAAAACDNVIVKIRALVRESCYTGVENQFSNGVSIYFPWSAVAPSYVELKFARNAGWNDFLHRYVKETRRKPRRFTKDGTELLKFVSDRPLTLAAALSAGDRFRKSDDRKSDDRGKNPVQSMRNPPVSIYKEGLSECIRANPVFVKRLETFSKIGARTRRG